MVLLACSRYYWQAGSAPQECINEAAKTQQVIRTADELRNLRSAVIGLEVCPVSGDQRLTSVRQNEHELQAAGHAGLPEDLQRLSLKWVMRTGDSHSFRKVLMVGSVWRFPSIISIEVGC
jgi:hypothetical protein